MGELALLSLTAAPVTQQNRLGRRSSGSALCPASHSVVITVKIAFYLYSEELSMERGDYARSELSHVHYNKT